MYSLVAVVGNKITLIDLNIIRKMNVNPVCSIPYMLITGSVISCDNCLTSVT